MSLKAIIWKYIFLNIPHILYITYVQRNEWLVKECTKIVNSINHQL